ncbi:hypothetical protein LguiA_036047 [Lonicera macranthoides]
MSSHLLSVSESRLPSPLERVELTKRPVCWAYRERVTCSQLGGVFSIGEASLQSQLQQLTTERISRSGYIATGVSGLKDDTACDTRRRSLMARGGMASQPPTYTEGKEIHHASAHR